MKKYVNYLRFNDKRGGSRREIQIYREKGGEASRAVWRVWTASHAVLSQLLLWGGMCSCVALIFDRVFQFARDDFKILLIVMACAQF